MNIKKTLSLLVVALTVAGTVSAQGYYDDDIYYDATKAKKEKAEKRKKQQAGTGYDGNGYYIDNQGVADYPAADTYNVNTANTRDVDEYNRRYEQPDSISLDDFAAGDFTYTRRIERFSNPSIVSGSDDDDLKEYYYSTSSAPQINLIVNTPGYYDAWSPYAWNMWDYPYCSPSWAWNYGWGLGPWAGSAWAWNWGPSWAWRPSWAWNWGWGPSWSWSWGGPAWYPHPGHGHGWGGGHHAWRPTSSGAYRPHTPSGGYNSSGVAGRRPGTVSNGRYSGSHRGNAMTGSWYNYNNSSNNSTNSPSVGTGSRPGQRPGAVNSGSSNNNYRNNNNNSGTRRNNSNNYNNSNSNRSSFNSGSRAGSRSGSGSFGGGSRSGGSRSGGGGRAGRR